MMLSMIVTTLLTVLNGFVAAQCTSADRIGYASQVPYAYNLSPLGASAAAFEAIPFNADCQTSIAANGAPAVPVAIDGNTTVVFAVATRQLFSTVTGNYIDFPANGTTDIQTNVTLGVRGIITIPVTFFANVYLDFDDDCTITAVRAFAEVPTVVLGLLLDPPAVPPGILPDDLIMGLLGGL
ncbi:uncharacterized protein LY89DRAFT_789560 [Mollisia scopiformis]|uniref:Uncharacterized protein n=1 Tax=Mollisia scopiformis TaxID=149040 RepID=A0A132B4W9_MOLSC|nr:uncharacterized protein LY89DRAFT_789560 [Mollisia scopiformis]KUJ07452.1 hypothetical protein LY89DRAFT_789560 [Mollisia scopiformis]